MLPTTVSRGRTPTRANPVFPQYLRRIVKACTDDHLLEQFALVAIHLTRMILWQQMDIEYTFWQMLNLCTSPKVGNQEPMGT